jgi:ketosteroid isomerase-like protein
MRTSPHAEQELRQLNAEWVKALIARDRASLERIMADDFIFTYPMDGDSKSQFIGDVESGDLVVEKLDRTKVEVSVFGPTAVLTALDDARWFYRGRAILGSYRVLQVYSNRNDKWQLVAVQACPISTS